MSDHQKSQTRLGVLCIFIAIFMYATVNAVVKDVLEAYPIIQIIFLRFSIALIPCIFMVYQSGGLKSLKTSNIKTHIFCGGIAFINLLLLFPSFKIIPLADATAMAFSSILFITLLSYPLLKEAVGLHRWLAVIGGFSGVLIMVNPSSNLFNKGALMCLLFALGDSFLMIFARLLARTDFSSTIVFYCCLFASLIASMFLPFIWITPTPIDFLKLAFLGIGAGSAQILLTYAYRYAQATQIAPVIYSSILWSSFYGYYFWNEIPSSEAIMGAGIIILSGLYLIYWESRQPTKAILKGTHGQDNLHAPPP